MYKLNDLQDFKYVTFPSFDGYDDLIHCFSTRNGGVSDGPFESMNIGFRTGDSAENVRRNIEIMAEKLNINVDDIVRTHQTHTNNVMYVTEEHKGKMLSSSEIENVDVISRGLHTNIFL